MKVQCCSCGEPVDISAGHCLEMFGKGYRAVGDALYCPTCVQGWNERAGTPFDRMFRAENLWGAYWWRWVCEKTPYQKRKERKKYDN